MSFRKMMRDKRKGKAFKRFAWIALGLAMLLGGAKVLQGMAIALIVVAGMFITMDAVPGLMRFAMTPVGYPIVVVATAFFVHALVGAGTLGGIIAIAFSLIVKMGVLDLVKDYHRGVGNWIGGLLCHGEEQMLLPKEG